LRFDWEPNGNWFVWDEGVNGNRPGEFVSAWHRVHDIFTSVGATNATWVWCPYADRSHSFGPLARYFPGRAYVDWTCLDGYNWSNAPENPHPWTSFDKLFWSSYSTIVKRLAPEKPMILGEMGSNGVGRAKAIWLKKMFSLLATKYRRVRGLIYFDQYAQGINWPIEASRATLKAFRRGVRPKAYRPNVYGGITQSPIGPPR
ncbi:MAG TPA: glycosyl hydrolase, partial [Solirubrobacterales bacterium]|nr:glycosyl hydrolase [Solirubrobacterales bacterium]